MSDLSTTYLGLKLSSPIIVGSSTHTTTVEKVKKLAAAGAGAVVLKSIFEEQIRADVSGMYEALESEGMHPEAYEYLQADLPMELGPAGYLDRLREIKAAVEIPVIASVNCTTPHGWVSFASKIRAVGAAAIELNLYDIATDAGKPGTEIEQRHLETVAAVCAESRLPVAVKIGPFYSSLANFVPRLAKAGAAGVVMFNRFFQPDIDPESMTLINRVNFSRSDDIRLPLRWIAILRDVLTCDLCLSGGVHDVDGVIKALLAGSNAVQICSLLYKQDASIITKMNHDLSAWMEQKGFRSLADFRGRLSEKNLPDKKGFERAQYVKALIGLE